MENTGSTHEALSGDQIEKPARDVVGLLIRDAAYFRLLEGIVSGLDLYPQKLEIETIRGSDLYRFEMLIADADTARTLRPMIYAQQATGEYIKPALIAVASEQYPASPAATEREDFDAVLALPEKPALLSAQLGVALYAHRAFAQRYQSALEELNLNRNIFRSVTSGISVANAQLPDMPLMYVNPAFEVMTGYTLEEVEGKNCRFLQNDEKSQPGLVLVREALKEKRETVAVLKNYRKDGSLFWNELALSPIHNRDGVLTHFVGIQMDVTERVEFETALRQSEKLAAVGRLASAIAHEINNPLEAVTNLVYLGLEFSKSGDHEQSRHFLEQADQQLRNIKLITARSLRFYKQSHGPEAITCRQLIGPVLEIYVQRLRNYGICVKRRLRSRDHIVCLASEIRQVLSNLVTNAIDAMLSAGGTLFVRASPATHWKTERRGMRITIADTGHGMAADTQSSIYRAFYTTKGDAGTGLGLWISSEILARHRGHMSMRSSQRPDRHGTVFSFFLPFQAASGEGTVEPQSEMPPSWSDD